MRAELAALGPGPARWRFALGCARVAVTRPTAIRAAASTLLVAAAAALGVALALEIADPALRAETVGLLTLLAVTCWLGRRLRGDRRLRRAPDQLLPAVAATGGTRLGVHRDADLHRGGHRVPARAAGRDPAALTTGRAGAGHRRDGGGARRAGVVHRGTHPAAGTDRRRRGAGAGDRRGQPRSSADHRPHRTAADRRAVRRRRRRDADRGAGQRPVATPPPLGTGHPRHSGPAGDDRRPTAVRQREPGPGPLRRRDVPGHAAGRGVDPGDRLHPPPGPTRDGRAARVSRAGTAYGPIPNRTAFRSCRAAGGWRNHLLRAASEGNENFMAWGCVPRH